MTRRDIRAARRGKQAARDMSYCAGFMGNGTPMPDEEQDEPEQEAPADWWPEPSNERTQVGPLDCGPAS